MKKQDGFLYILRHPCRVFSDYGVGDDEYLFKIGVTTRTVNIRLKQHNTDFKKHAGKVVQETGQLWEVHEVYSVQNVYVAESIFWKNTKFADIPFMGGVEIIAMKSEEVQQAIDVVLKLSTGASRMESW
ncbi:GIY-YIG nuclease family protein [Polynucleobacter sinensis]|uniref:GIY-YIG nuclease family protein n=1 Tax=Polynucleobacter sinensis TaxID=1743157 RepID=UPI000780F5F7|nr:GIY-YIG nuclease family protein [Polynucleobacter sinensis]